MSSYDFVTNIRIERYPNYDKGGTLIDVSYGCPTYNLMGYESLAELMFDIEDMILKEIKTKLEDLKKND